MVSRSFAAVLICFGLAACGPASTDGDAAVGASTPAQAEPASAQDPATKPAPRVSLTSPLEYPETQTVAVTDIMHGVSVEDPYRWLEADVRTSADVEAWVEAQSELTRAYLDALPGRDAIEARTRALWTYERTEPPVTRGTRLFYLSNRGDEAQPSLYVQDGPDGAPRVIADPARWSSDGSVAIGDFWPSPSGALVAYSIQQSGSDWRTIRVIDAESGDLIPYAVDWVKFAPVAWSPDGAGFYYARYPAPETNDAFLAPNLGEAVYFHALDAPQREDTLVYSRPEAPEVGFRPQVSSDGRWLVITAWRSTDAAYEVVVLSLVEEDAEPRLLVGGFLDDYDFIRADGRELVFRTDRDAPMGRVVAIDVSDPAPHAWRELIPQSDMPLREVTFVGGVYLAQYLEDARSLVRRFDEAGGEIGFAPLPEPGVAYGFQGDGDDRATYFSFSSLTRAPTLYRLNPRSGGVVPFRAPVLPYDPDDYVVEPVFVDASDGARLPVFIAHRRGLDRDAPQPTLLYGYGGFDIAATPDFSPARLAWMDMGGVYVHAILRGGGEYGADWHEAGRKLNKQRVFDDFTEIARYLISEGWTSSDALAIHGRSNGGLLVGAVVNQHPDLFAAALPAVGVMDMLRFSEFTAGRFWVGEYGAIADQSEFAALYRYSPYHNVRGGTAYPAILATTADTDDRVVPSHTFKFAAALQALDTGPAPKLVRIDRAAGHGAGKSTDQRIAETADMWAFAAYHTGLAPPQ